MNPDSSGPRTKRILKRVLPGAALLLLLALAVGGWMLASYVSSLPIVAGLAAGAPSENTRWPWKAEPQVLGRGVRAWSVASGDGTLVRLMHFDLGANPRLKFSIWDNEAHDDKPGDNLLHYWPHGVAQVTQRLNRDWKGTRQVLAASNGAFFGYANKVPGPSGVAFHVGPMVLDGKIFFNGKNHRWTFGTKKIGGRQVFDVAHLPNRAALERFEWAAGSVQCLVKDGAAQDGAISSRT